MALLRVKLKPRSHKDALLSIDEAGLLSASVTASPVQGAANKALEVLLAGELGVPKTSVTVVRGHTARTKTVEVAGISDEELRAKLTTILG